MTRQRLVIDSSDQGKLILLVEEGKITLGGDRNPAETVIQNLRIRRVHCELEVEGDHVAVSGSISGQETATPREWRLGEVIHSAGCDLWLEAAQEDASEQIGLLSVDDQPALLKDEEQAPKESSPAPASQGEAVSAGAGQRKRLLVIDGADEGRYYALVGAEPIYIGKDRRNAEIILNDLYVARVHCQIRIEGDQVTVIEEEGGRSAGGTLVNGQKITRHLMQVGDVLRVGNSHLRLEIDTGKDPAASGAEIPVARDDDSDEEPVVGVVDDEAEVVEEDSEVEVVEEDVEVVEVEEADAEVVEEVEEAEDSEDVPEPVRLLQAGRQRLAHLTGQAFGHFRLSKLLGRGRSGVVFQALDVKDVKNSQVVALKVFAPPAHPSDQELHRFARVVKAILPLRHPNLVTLHSAGKTGSNIWIAREFVEGESVAEVLRRLGGHKKPDWRRALRVAIHVSRALDYAQEHQFHHGKIAPPNLLIQKEDRATRLTDLMLTRALEGSQLLEAVQASQRAADLAYLAPEQLERSALVNGLSDLYSLGAVVYALLTGRPPFQGDSAEEVLKLIRGSSRIENPRALNNTVPPALEKVVLKLLSRHAEDRYETPAELLTLLESIAEDEEVEV